MTTDARRRALIRRRRWLRWRLHLLEWGRDFLRR